MAKLFDEIMKFNPYHGKDGRFATADAATSFTYAPGKSKAHDLAIQREKERQAAGGGDDDDTVRMNAVHQVEDKIRHQFYESAAVIDGKGNILFRKDGAIGEVGFTKEEREMMKDNTVTHNHPDDTMLSVQDVYAFMRDDVLEMRATTKDGTTYSIKRGEGYDKDRAQRFVIDYDGEMKAAKLVAERETLKLRGDVMDGTMSAEQFNYEYGKVVTSEMVKYCEGKASDYNLAFSVEKREVKNTVGYEVYTGKSAENTDEGTFSIFKTDQDKRLVFGWASVAITADGQQIEDVQKDMIDPEDLEEAAYSYVLNFRDTGEEHIPTLRKKGKLVESCVFTKEKQAAIGIPEGIVPEAWWVGFYIEDDEAWEKIKNGTYTMFSIEGKAKRVPVEKSAEERDPKMVAKSFNEILGIEPTRTISKSDPDRFDQIVEKFNPYHDAKGRFTSANAAASFTFTPGKSNAHTTAIAREAAKGLVAKAKAKEPELTSMLSGCAAEAGGEMVGLDFAVKSEESLTRKIKTEMLANGLNATAAVGEMRDVNRYTMQLKEDNFGAGYEATMKTLTDKGYEIVKVKNTLADPNASYRGINTNLRDKDGTIWELQFHTEKSLEIKEINHKLYEEQRLDNTPAARRKELDKIMADNAAAIPMPKGVENIANVNKL